MARAGRPPKGAQGPRRTVRRTTRLTEEEAERLDRKAREEGITVSDYLRILACLEPDLLSAIMSRLVVPQATGERALLSDPVGKGSS